MTTFTRNSADVARIILANPDGTYNLDGERVMETEGYEVGGYDPDMPKPFPRLDAGHAEDQLAERIFHLRREAAKGLHGSSPIRLGRWTDDHDVIHLDATRHVPGVALAMGAGRLLGQEAIWSWAEGEALEVLR